MVVLALVMATATVACSAATGAVSVEDPWARSNPNGLGAVYAVVTSPVDDELVAARVDASIAGSVEVHEVLDEGGLMRMQQVAGVALPAGEPVALAPGGYHLMLLDMPAMLSPGTRFDVTLVLASGSEVTISAEVRESTEGGMHGGSDTDETEMDMHGGMGS
jgi:periplasmic copper chaperone A